MTSVFNQKFVFDAKFENLNLNFFHSYEAPQSLEDDKTSEKSAPSSSKKVSKEKKLSSVKKILDCPIEGCNRSFCKESALQNHIKRHNRLFKCDQCDKTFTEQAKVCQIIQKIGQILSSYEIRKIIYRLISDFSASIL